MKHVQENLFQFKDYSFFRLFEEEEEIKKIAQEQEEVGNSIVDKVKENFSRFEKDANGFVIKYKEFWQENESMKANFEEGAKTYKLFDSTYVVGLMTLPDEALESDVIGQELSSTENEVENDKKETDKLLGEAEVPEEGNNLNFEEPDNLETNKKEIPVEEHPIEDEEVLDTPGEPKMCLVVYNMLEDQRDEIFRCSINSVMHAFEDFYENIFKGSMKAIISKVREKQEEIKKDMEVKAKEKEIEQKKSKVDQFLKESGSRR
jgi:hypothetical protein